jgi:hypothetical protein
LRFEGNQSTKFRRFVVGKFKLKGHFGEWE